MNMPRAAIRRLAQWLAPKLYERLVRARSAAAAERSEAAYWRPRANEVVMCPDNVKLKRHPDAGRISGGMQCMFNGIQVPLDGYYGKGMTELLRRNKGSHEPQEELVFADVLKRMPRGANMVECGAYWGFYSAWFARDVVDAKVWLIEPEASHLAIGRRTFAANGVKGDFLQALIGHVSTADDTPSVSLDDFLRGQDIHHLDILHADIQGAEVDMLLGAANLLSEGRVDFVFISTHSESLHSDCVKLLTQYGYEVPVSVPPAASYSFDGLVVAHRKEILNSPLPLPSLKPSAVR